MTRTATRARGASRPGRSLKSSIAGTSSSTRRYVSACGRGHTIRGGVWHGRPDRPGWWSIVSSGENVRPTPFGRGDVQRLVPVAAGTVVGCALCGHGLILVRVTDRSTAHGTSLATTSFARQGVAAHAPHPAHTSCPGPPRPEPADQSSIAGQGPTAHGRKDPSRPRLSAAPLLPRLSGESPVDLGGFPVGDR